METSSPTMTDLFRGSSPNVGDFDAETAAKLVAAVSDIALVLDESGRIEDVAAGARGAPEIDTRAWIGRHWGEVVTSESRPKVDELLREAMQRKTPRWRQLNHPSPTGTDHPVSYSAVRIGTNGRIVAIGRELGAMSALQQRLISAQQSMEREYSRLRSAEMRYRLLFQITSEPVIVVEVVTRRVTEANPAALGVLGGETRRVTGRQVLDLFDPAGRTAVGKLLQTVETAGRHEEVSARLVDGTPIIVAAALFRQDNSTYFLMRVNRPQTDSASLESSVVRLSKIVENIPDGFVITDAEGRILSANHAFLDMVQASTIEQVRGEALGAWLGRPGVDFPALVESLKKDGQVKNLPTIVRGTFDLVEDVEISAVLIMDGDRHIYGFTLRHISLRPSADKDIDGIKLPRSVEQLTRLVGRVPLKEMVRETTDLIERLCIEAALDLTGDNRASAAEMLGLSRQSLYSKLRRYDMIGENDPDDE